MNGIHLNQEHLSGVETQEHIAEIKFDEVNQFSLNNHGNVINTDVSNDHMETNTNDNTDTNTNDNMDTNTNDNTNDNTNTNTNDNMDTNANDNDFATNDTNQR